MELEDLRSELNELRPEDEDAEDSVRTLMVMLGEMADTALLLDEDDDGEEARASSDGEDADARPDSPYESESVDELHRAHVGSLIVAAAEYAEEHDVDLDHAVEERLDDMREMVEKQQKVEEAYEEGDAEKLAEVLGSDANEVPTGIMDDEDDEDDDPRYIG